MARDNSRNRSSDADIDISTPQSGPQINWVWSVGLWLSVFAGALILMYMDKDVFTSMIWIVGAAVVLFALWLGYTLFIKRGVFTWMRLAKKPERLMAQGDEAGAEAAYHQALAKAKQYAPNDLRRGIMLCELAMYIKNQGRYPEAIAMYEESAEILAQHLAKEPMGYFVCLNNYSLCFIHLRDHENAQRILEKVLDLTLATKKREQGRLLIMPVAQLQSVEFVLNMNLLYLFIEMNELDEAQRRERVADDLVDGLPWGTRRSFGDHYLAVKALLAYALGQFGEAADLVARARNPNYQACLRVRAKLHLVKREYAEAEALLRKHQAEELKKGPLHRPELESQWMELAESLYGQGKHTDAIAALEKARRIVADFKMPRDRRWKRSLEAWLSRVDPDLRATLDSEIAAIPEANEQAITILEKFRVHPRE